MHKLRTKLPTLVQFVVLLGLLASLALFQGFLNRSGIESYFSNQNSLSSPTDKDLKTISLACLFSEELKPNQTLEALLSAKGLPAELIRKLSDPLKRFVNLRQLRPGELFSLWSSPDASWLLLEYEKSPTEVYRVAKEEESISAYSLPVYLERKVVSASAEVKSTLWEALADQIKSPEIVLQLSDIFAWEIDFLTETRPGDKLKFIYEEYQKDGELIEYGEVLAAEVVMSGQVYRAYLFADPRGHKGYYDDAGHPLYRTFLKSPLNYRRISSKFSYSRNHPVFHTPRPHYGVDYAAPVGTPVVATGDGVVKFAGWKGGLGRYIEIRHSNGWVTGYGHLSRFAEGVRVGKRMEQKDVIGYVGMTGWTTGPHLDYRVQISGRFVNPLTVKSPAANPVPQDYLSLFDEQKQRLAAELNAVTPVFASQKN